MDIVVFLEARLAEEESNLVHADPSDPLARNMLAECAQKRLIVEDWKRAAAAEGTSCPVGALAMVRRSLLVILAAAYKNHPEYSSDWLG